MVEFLEVDALQVIKKAIPCLVLLAATQKNDAVAELHLAQSIQLLDVFLHPYAVHAQKVAFRIMTVLLLDLASCPEVGIRPEIQLHPVWLTLIALRSSHSFVIIERVREA